MVSFLTSQKNLKPDTCVRLVVDFTTACIDIFLLIETRCRMGKLEMIQALTLGLFDDSHDFP